MVTGDCSKVIKHWFVIYVITKLSKTTHIMFSQIFFPQEVSIGCTTKGNGVYDKLSTFIYKWTAWLLE